jgi:hypothetical protein
MIFQPLPPQAGQTVSVGMIFYYRAAVGELRSPTSAKHADVRGGDTARGRRGDSFVGCAGITARRR